MLRYLLLKIRVNWVTSTQISVLKLFIKFRQRLQIHNVIVLRIGFKYANVNNTKILKCNLNN
jgi:hypothetical protein